MKTITYDDTLYQLVPKEATLEMHKAYRDVLAIGSELDAAMVYRSMLSAAPTPPAQPIERMPQEWMPIEAAPIGKEMIVVRGFNVCNSYTGDRQYTTDPYCVWQPIYGAFARWPHAFLPTHWMPLPAPPKQEPKD